MMRFTPLRCPECNELPKGTLDTVEGIAHLHHVTDGDDLIDYGGWTEVLWDTQRSNRDDQGKVTLIGTCDHTWQAEMVDVEPDHTPDDKCDCESPGFFCSGAPGILAHMEDGRLAEGAGVERCDLCERYPTDQAAMEEMRRRGLV
jgi:hypothetical protein